MKAERALDILTGLTLGLIFGVCLGVVTGVESVRTTLDLCKAHAAEHRISTVSTELLQEARCWPPYQEQP